jgi:hypothetical protein
MLVYMPESEPEVADANFAFGEGPVQVLYVCLMGIPGLDVLMRRY